MTRDGRVRMCPCETLCKSACWWWSQQLGSLCSAASLRAVFEGSTRRGMVHNETLSELRKLSQARGREE